MNEGARTEQLREVGADGSQRGVRRDVPIEAPVAIEINGIGYAVMMATPDNLEDYALGFCLSEQLIASPTEFAGAEAAELDHGGWVLRVNLAPERAAPLHERARLRLSEGSCGLCGSESVAQVLRPLPAVAGGPEVADAAIFRAVAELPARQELGAATRAVHAAAFCSPTGEVLTVREDVGRHNAFDKLLGALAREGRAPRDGFVLLTARCSFELVQKAVIAGVPVLATISAPTSLALDRARAAGLRLVTVARSDSFLES